MPAFTIPAGGAVRESQADILKRFAIDPETRDYATPHSGVRSVGYSPTKKKWYGWSHRAVGGFADKAAAQRFANSVS